MRQNPLLRCVMFGVLTLAAQSGHATDATSSPQAGARTYAQNYKDMVLAECIATAYRNEPSAAMDAGSSASALMDWTDFDLERNPGVGKSLVNRFLARDYHNPIVESEIKGVRFDFLKCLDLYHSQELDAQVKRFVTNPKRSYRLDNRSSDRSK
ncbi:type VI secretion system amidase immunity protein Tai4 [Burkholderia pyrrocinia]|uniref:type VI secretion system amidase immunity protein Tai4 n=1 Tax=Burkholderia pyrrocinia TaxID=60550 RepID=UPI001FB5117D|nr:type VI secretion system amidase immunity protein Tai4 [Burkholderia pyrrocinia]UOB56366.1 type VI secretion system amidase immunity protein Tai4 [Burkholderia pyrrocinia]